MNDRFYINKLYELYIYVSHQKSYTGKHYPKNPFAVPMCDMNMWKRHLKKIQPESSWLSKITMIIFKGEWQHSRVAFIRFSTPNLSNAGLK